MRRSIVLTSLVALALAACGDDGPSGQAQSEEGAIEATVTALEATLRGDADGVLNFASAECREGVDRQEIELGLLFMRSFMEEGDLDLDSVTINGEIESYDGDTATVQITYEVPDSGDGLEGLFFDDDEYDLIYEDGRWVTEDCNLGDGSGGGDDGADEREAELAALGVAGTQDDPVPAGAAISVGGGFRVVVGDYSVDVADEIAEATGFTPFVEEGDIAARLQYQLAYVGDDEPASASDISITAFGANGVELDGALCSYPGEPEFGTRLFMGAVADASVCVTGPADQLESPIFSITVGFGDAAVFVDPAAAAASPETLTGTTGPSPDGDLTDDRTAPAAIGTTVELDEGWSMTVNGATLDATDLVLAESGLSDPPAAGLAYSLVDVTLTYDGDEPASPSNVTMVMVGDDNIGASDGCSFASGPDAIDQFSDLLPGSSVTGTICFETSTDSHSSLVLMATDQFFDQDWAFFALG